ncbi:shikimate dehydrogenase [Anaerovorax odorimutans]|uniref:shikimate dehydrogenase n=1 Tax=Anaerovorax odorimutans TaxID=109327 RepID=UPI0003F5CB91|nr:shikimate dehydrogenase [Anaerovorax odorimutans]
MIKLGLIGEKLSHSLSPEIHKKFMEQNNIDGSYELIEIPMENFESDFNVLKKSNYTGVNITIPYKEKVIPLLDEISPQAKFIGAVNTVLFRNGKAIGYNTDYNGFVSTIQHNNTKIKGKSAVILGAGGVSKAVIKGLLDEGISDITIVSRNKNNFHSLYTISYEFFKEANIKCDILINCTPVGMYPNVNASPISKDLIKAEVAIDMIYNPEKTLFLKYAEELGIKIINGSHMLYEQAIAAQKIWNS